MRDTENRPTLADKLHSSTVHLEFYELLYEFSTYNADQLLTIVQRASEALTQQNCTQDAILMQGVIGRLFTHLGTHKGFVENRYLHFTDKVECLETELRESRKAQVA